MLSRTDPDFPQHLRGCVEGAGPALRLARRITHRNVCRIYEFSRAEGTAYISMELVEGVSLRRLLKDIGEFDVPRSLEVMMQVCDGLNEAHRQGIVHRDLKPENIML